MDPKVSNNITPILLLGPDGRAAKKRIFQKQRQEIKTHMTEKVKKWGKKTNKKTNKINLDK